jgi:two-component system sensor histidine kinase DesK
MRTSGAPHVPPLRQQFAILVFISFYFMRWFFPMTALDWLVSVSGLLIFLLCYFTAFNVQRLTLPAALAMVALAVGVAPFNNGANTFAIYAASFFAYFFPPRTALLLLAMNIAALAAATYFFELHFIFYFVIGAVSSIGIATSGIVDRQRLIHERQERRSQEEVQRLAKIAERERISQDLHDTIGHSLTAINLKTQLAIKQLERDLTVEARQNLEQVQQLAQTALKDIRHTVAGIKKLGLEEELEAQRDLLHSLGIELRYRLPQTLLAPTLESDLLLIAREAITNILRHANATRCELLCQSSGERLEVLIRDNGKGMSDIGEAHFGNGLRGILQRVNLRRGRLAVNPPERLDADWPGLTLLLDLPWPSGTPMDHWS